MVLGIPTCNNTAGVTTTVSASAQPVTETSASLSLSPSPSLAVVGPPPPAPHPHPTQQQGHAQTQPHQQQQQTRQRQQPRDPIQAAISTAAAIAAATGNLDSSAMVPTSKPQPPVALTPAIPPIAARPPMTVPAAPSGPSRPAPAAPAPLQPLHFAYPPPQQLPATTVPPIMVGTFPQAKPAFDRMKLRRGKWTAEEEAYADLLIEEFERGVVEGCENGSTLRSFLSKKLHCAPMRISKKYAGKSIGKHVFLSRSNINGIGGFAKNGEVQVDNRARLKELEAKFYKSLCQESDSSLGMGFLGHTAFPAFLQSQVAQAALSNVPLPATLATPPFLGFPPGSNSMGLGGPMTHPGSLLHSPWAPSPTVPAPNSSVPAATTSSVPSFGQYEPSASLRPSQSAGALTTAGGLPSQPPAANTNATITTGVPLAPHMHTTYTGSLDPQTAITPVPTQAPGLHASPTRVSSGLPTTTTQPQPIQPATIQPAPVQPMLPSSGMLSRQHPPTIHPPPTTTLSPAVSGAAAPVPDSHPTSIGPPPQTPGPSPSLPTPLQQPASLPRHHPHTIAVMEPTPIRPTSTSGAGVGPMPPPPPIAPASIGVPQPIHHRQHQQQRQHAKAAPASQQQPGNDIPDFLSGFEKVTATTAVMTEKTMTTAAAATTTSAGANTLTTSNKSGQSSQYSPPFTSRSFDDFHRYLGKGLSPQPFDLMGRPILPGGTDVRDGNFGGPNGNTSVSNGPAPTPTSTTTTASTTSVTADSYALFAQESAQAVSYHSAYCRSEGINPGFLSDAPSSEVHEVPMYPVDTTINGDIDPLHGPIQQEPVLVPTVVNEANLRAHAAATEPVASLLVDHASANVVSGSDRETSTEDESAIGSSRGSDSADNSSNESDGASDGPISKKRRLDDVSSYDAVPSASGPGQTTSLFGYDDDVMVFPSNETG